MRHKLLDVDKFAKRYSKLRYVVILSGRSVNFDIKMLLTSDHKPTVLRSIQSLLTSTTTMVRTVEPDRSEIILSGQLRYY